MTREIDRAAAPQGVTVIRPPHGWSGLQLAEVWRARDLLGFLARRDIKVRYSQAAIGIAWALLQPLSMVLIFSIFLGRLARVPTEGIPYPVFVIAGLVPWTFFSNAIRSSSESLVNDAALITKVYFPRLLIPVAAMLSWIPDVAISTGILAALMVLEGVSPPPTLLLTPAFAALALLTAGSVSIWLSALNVRYRDVRYAVPVILQLWLFASPVLYPSTLVPVRYRFILGLNPMSGVVDGFRWSTLGGPHPSWGLLAVSALIMMIILVSGLFYFRRMEHVFADVI